MTYDITIQNMTDDEIPNEKMIKEWISMTLAQEIPSAGICIRIVSEEESQQLNKQYRQQNKSTNVLSFPAGIPSYLAKEIPLLGDIAVCSSVIKREAAEQGKTVQSHWAHIIIHGVLHLLGYDHIKDSDAAIMENKEITLLNQLGYSNPY